MNYKHTDGGRKEAGYKGTTGDCGVRAMAIAMGLPYKEVYKELATANKAFGFAKSARNGLLKEVFESVLNKHGWFWVKAPKFIGRKARCLDLTGLVIARQAHHFVAVLDGIPQDTFDSSQKCVYGFWQKK
jgi:hypothetical protein